MKKILKNNSGNTLAYSIVFVIVVAMISIITILISLRQIQINNLKCQKEAEKIKLETALYDYLNFCIERKGNIHDVNYQSEVDENQYIYNNIEYASGHHNLCITVLHDTEEPNIKLKIEVDKDYIIFVYDIAKNGENYTFNVRKPYEYYDVMFNAEVQFIKNGTEVTNYIVTNSRISNISK